jgi:hypothetical protein
MLRGSSGIGFRDPDGVLGEGNNPHGRRQLHVAFFVPKDTTNATNTKESTRAVSDFATVATTWQVERWHLPYMWGGPYERGCIERDNLRL